MPKGGSWKVGLVCLVICLPLAGCYPQMPEPTCEGGYPTHFRGYATVNGIRLYHEIHGTGDAVFLLHGGMLSGAESWSRIIPRLAGRHRLIVPDTRAHGRSTDTDGPFGYEQLSNDIVALMDNLAIDRAHIVGWSDGGVIGLELAMRYPERVHKLAVYGTNFHHNGLPTAATEEIRAMTGDSRPAWIADLTYRNIAPDPSRMDEMVRKVARMWLTEPTWSTDDLAQVQIPVMVMEDADGQAIRPEHTESMVAALPNAHLVLFDDGQHMAPQVASDLFASRLMEFLGAP